ncbi:hypothetical protein KYJ26_23415 [Bacillus sp. MCCB 382]|uniref:hypothetical protein n=1 Tax=Bacillus sp. MCCB 382 TaxID=2860197 RepID=UPI001C5736D5|nr:hypothetical protein [Bacillus sp. MCCB 382]
MFNGKRVAIDQSFKRDMDFEGDLSAKFLFYRPNTKTHLHLNSSNENNPPLFKDPIF